MTAEPSSDVSRVFSPRASTMMVVAAAACWGTWSLWLRPSGIEATLSGPMIFTVMALVGLPFALREPAVTWTRTAILLVVGNGMFDALNVRCFFGAMDHTSVAIAVTTHYLAPVIIALLSPVVDRVSVRGAPLAAIVALGGLTLILTPWRDTGSLTGAALGACSAFCYAGNVFTVRRLGSQVGTWRAVSYHSAIAAVLLLPEALPHLGSLTAHGAMLVGGGGVLCGVVPGALFVAALPRVGSARAAILCFTEPLVAVLVGATVWDEPLPASAIAGAALVLAAGIHVARKSG